MKTTENLQKLLPFGYLYLVILGIIKESIFYYQLKINILRHSNIMDILISPIADLTSHPIVFFSCLFFVLLIYLFTYYLSKNYKKEWIRKFLIPKKLSSDLTEEYAETHFKNMFIAMLGFGLLSFFLGIGLGKGSSISERLKKDDLKYEHLLTFNTNETKEVYLIGSNSANYFYAVKGSQNIRISPIGAIKVVEVKSKTNETSTEDVQKK